ncbi:MAG TPA: beta-ketoacyl synthase N-terminal-like domain-containing protein, partial [Chloroflexota bacterium]
IAVVGMGCRFPGGSGPDEFWRRLRDGNDSITEVPVDRWDGASLYDPNAGVQGTMNTRWGGFLTDIAGFDPAFFGISPRGAAAMDPQHRLLLEVAWETFEDAYIPPNKVAGERGGVFVGISHHDYAHRVFGDIAAITAYALPGNALSMAANRLSHFFDLRGPSMSVDTGCSSSLEAVHLACSSLREGECDIALAGGVQILVTPHTGIASSQLWMLASGPHHRSFDCNGDGSVRGEGCGLVLLKRLADADRDRDHIAAVIRGSAVSHSGRSSGMLAPSAPLQADAIARALRSAGVERGDISYVEAHGSGSAGTDDIEMQGLQMAYGGRMDPCLVGSVKSNIGTLEAAAGVAGLLKCILALEHGYIPPTLHVQHPLQRIAQDSEFELVTHLVPFPRATGHRLSGVNSYGLGGTSVHLILGETPSTQSGLEHIAGSYLLCLSARNRRALSDQVTAYQENVHRIDDTDLAVLCDAANAGRTHFPHRLAIAVDSASLMRAALDGAHHGKDTAGLYWTNPGDAQHTNALPLVSVYHDEGSSDTLKRSARSFVQGAGFIDSHVRQQLKRPRRRLPVYPFQRTRCWMDGG